MKLQHLRKVKTFSYELDQLDSLDSIMIIASVQTTSIIAKHFHYNEGDWNKSLIIPFPAIKNIVPAHQTLKLISHSGKRTAKKACQDTGSYPELVWFQTDPKTQDFVNLWCATPSGRNLEESSETESKPYFFYDAKLEYMLDYYDSHFHLFPNSLKTAYLAEIKERVSAPGRDRAARTMAYLTLLQGTTLDLERSFSIESPESTQKKKLAILAEARHISSLALVDRQYPRGKNFLVGLAGAYFSRVSRPFYDLKPEWKEVIEFLFLYRHSKGPGFFKARRESAIHILETEVVEGAETRDQILNLTQIQLESSDLKALRQRKVIGINPTPQEVSLFWTAALLNHQDVGLLNEVFKLTPTWEAFLAFSKLSPHFAKKISLSFLR